MHKVGITAVLLLGITDLGFDQDARLESCITHMLTMSLDKALRAARLTSTIHIMWSAIMLAKRIDIQVEIIDQTVQSA